MSESLTYTPPAIWQWNKENGGQFASINRPVAGATHDKELPVGKHPLQLYSMGTPNGVKVTVMLEELLALGHSGAEYDAWLIRINEGEQFGSGFVSVNPNSKIPALLDRTDPSNPVRVFESGAILMYLAEKFGSAFLPKDGAARAECLSWLFWQMGSAPFVGGGFGHFYAYAPVKIEYAIDRYAMEAKRQQLFEHHRHLHAIGRGQRIQLQRMPPHGQFLVVRGTGDGPVDAGELAAVFFVPLPNGGGGVGGRGGHARLQAKRVKKGGGAARHCRMSLAMALNHRWGANVRRGRSPLTFRRTGPRCANQALFLQLPGSPWRSSSSATRSELVLDRSKPNFRVHLSWPRQKMMLYLHAMTRFARVYGAEASGCPRCRWVVLLGGQSKGS